MAGPLDAQLNPILGREIMRLRALALNSGVIQTQEGRHLLNAIIRVAEIVLAGDVLTPTISTHHE